MRTLLADFFSILLGIDQIVLERLYRRTLAFWPGRLESYVPAREVGTMILTGHRWYVELLRVARTPLAGFFSILLADRLCRLGWREIIPISTRLSRTVHRSLRTSEQVVELLAIERVHH